MSEIAHYDLELTGCTPEPLMAYLKSLGILRLVSEQKDPDARGWWRNDMFSVRSALDRDTLLRLFLEEYKPTPIVAPWAGGSGFFKKDNKNAVEALRDGKSSRVHPYASVIGKVHTIIENENVGDKPREEDKVRLICRYRRELPDEVVVWMDSAMVLHRAGQGFAPLLGTGGNDGRLDFTQNFMQRIVSLGLHKDDTADNKSRAWLEQALFATPVTLDSASVGQFAPGRAGGPNATQGMEGDSTDNPWDFILMLEGALMLAGGAVRRFGLGESTRAAFPFTVRAVAAGFDTPASKDEAESRGELWLPLWNRPTTASELRCLFGEGRADASGRRVRNGTDFARAVAGLGVDRGIAGFVRLSFLKRSGKAFLAVPIGRFASTERRDIDLLSQIDPWLDRFRSACASKDAPARFGRTVRQIDSAIFDFCRYGGSTFFQRILIAFGGAERELSRAERFVDVKNLRPIAGLSREWLNAANDNSPEFMVALALASVHDPTKKISPLRANLEAVDWQKRNRTWAEKDRSVVWNAADVPTNLANVLQRRIMDGERAGCERLPLAYRFGARLDSVAAFIEGDLDDERIKDLLWGLMLVDSGGQRGQEKIKSAAPPDHPLPREYALLKLLFLPSPLTLEGRGEETRWRFAREGEPGIAIRPEPRVLPLLRSARVGEACRIAAQRLRVSGLPPMPGFLSTGAMRDVDWSECSADTRRSLRLAAALLIPISSLSVSRLVHLVCRDPSAAESLAVNSEGGPTR
jgi:CRISPR-associated protein Csx17